jgi:hypothetical protein
MAVPWHWCQEGIAKAKKVISHQDLEAGNDGS